MNMPIQVLGRGPLMVPVRVVVREVVRYERTVYMPESQASSLVAALASPDAAMREAAGAALADATVDAARDGSAGVVVDEPEAEVSATVLTREQAAALAVADAEGVSLELGLSDGQEVTR